MYLSIHKLDNNETVTTTERINDTMTIRGIRLRLYKHGTPDGTLTLTLKDGTTTIGTSVNTLAVVNADISGTYFHGYVLFEFTGGGVRVNVDPTTAYKELNMEITLTSHTDDANNYVGLVKNFGDMQFITPHGTITNGDNMTAEQLTHFQPFGVEILRIK